MSSRRWTRSASGTCGSSPSSPAGRCRSARSATAVVLGLPGNPVAVFVCFLFYVWPLLRRMGGGAWPGETRRFDAALQFAFPDRKVGRREFWRGMLRKHRPAWRSTSLHVTAPG